MSAPTAGYASSWVTSVARVWSERVTDGPLDQGNAVGELPSAKPRASELNRREVRSAYAGGAAGDGPGEGAGLVVPDGVRFS
jgi:hypothetical protein